MSLPRSKTIGIILARLDSSRLPRKQLRLINGKPMIDHIIERLRKVIGVDQIVLATGPQRENEDLARHVHRLGVDTYYDQDVNDVTGRITRTAECFNAKYIVTISGDCPLIDPDFIDKGILILKQSGADYVRVDHSKYECLHEGIEFHTKENWQELYRLSTTWYHKEHPGSIIKEKNNLFRSAEIMPETVFQRHDFRMSVDTHSDLIFMNVLFNTLASQNISCSLLNVVRLIDKMPWIKSINQHVYQKKIKDISPTFLFVTYASQEVGLGHLSRCIAIASELKECYGARTFFYINSNGINERILENNGLSYLDNCQFGDEDRFKHKLMELSPLKVIVDITNNLLNNDLQFINQLDLHVVLIDQYPRGKSNNVTSIIPSINLGNFKRKHNVYLGKEYIITSREIQFWRNNKSIIQENTITVMSGGSSIPEIKLISGLPNLNEAIIRFIIGPYAERNILEERLRDHCKSNYEIYQNPQSIFLEIKKSKFVIMPFGISTYECIALGVPVVVYSVLWERDIELVEHLEEQKVIYNGIDKYVKEIDFTGYIRYVAEDVTKNDATKLGNFLSGSGTSEVAKIIMK